MKLPCNLPAGKVGSEMDWQFELTMKPKDPMAFRQMLQNTLLYKKYPDPTCCCGCVQKSATGQPW